MIPSSLIAAVAEAGSAATSCSRLAVSFSGGRSSAVMVDQILEKWGDSREIVICFANTGKEEEETLRFVDAVDRNFCQPRGYKVHWLEAEIHGPGKGPTAKEVTYRTANRDGKVFEAAIAKHGVFCKTHPQCTSRLKDEPMDWWRKKVLGWDTYETAIGIRADEIDRVSTKAKERRFIYPLVDWGWRKRDVSQYMERFDWDLKLPGDHWGNCDACWKKSLRKLMTRAKEDPSVFAWWGRMERKYGMVSKGEPNKEPRVFFRGERSAQDILMLAQTEDFEPYEDEKYDNPELFDKWWDVGAGCGESCEIGADDIENDKEALASSALFSEYVDYVKNVGGSAAIDWFDDDWEPIGPKVRADMVKAGIAKEEDGYISLENAQALAQPGHQNDE